MAASATERSDARNANRWREFWPAFREGATKASLPGVIGVVLLAGLHFATILLVVTEDRVAAWPHETWMDNPQDHHAYVTVEALRMQRAEVAELGVAVVGSSSIRHAFEDHFAFRDRLTEAMDEPVRLHFLPTGAQSLWESALLLDYLPEGFRGAVVIGVHPGRTVFDEAALSEWLANPRIGLQSETRVALRERLGLPRRDSTGSYWVDNIGFFSARQAVVLRNLWWGAPRYEQHSVRVGRPASPEARAVLASGMAETMESWERGGSEGSRALEQLVSGLVARGIEVVVTFEPLHPNVRTLHPAVFARFREMTVESAQAGGASVLDLGESARLLDREFRDVFHLFSSGPRERCEDVLAVEIARALQRVRLRSPGARPEAAS
jgi:hypothetical protein